MALVHCHIDLTGSFCPLSLWERVRVRGFNETLGDPHPCPLPEGEGAKTGGAANRQTHVDAALEGDGMAVVYVLQVMAHHGYGLEGWRTVRKPSGEPYSFETREAAQAALQQHFSNLRDGLNVRVHTMDAEAAQRAMPAVPRDPTSSSAPAPLRQPADPSP